MLCHRDYTSLAHSQIRLYDDHLVFRNAGSLPISLSLEAFFKEHDSFPRNPLIADAFFYMGLVEKWGSGTTRIVSELQNSELGGFKVTFYKTMSHKGHIEESPKPIDLTARQIQAIDYVKKNGRISNMDYQKLFAVSKRTATRDLKELKAKGIFASQGDGGRGMVYLLNNGAIIGP